VGFSAPSASGVRGADPKDMIATLGAFNRLLAGATEDLRSGRRTAAADKLTRALAINERAYDLHVTLGDLYLESGKYERSLGEYEAAALLNPTGADPLLGAASALLAQGNVDLASRKIDEAEKREPQSYQVPFARGKISERSGRNREALAFFERAVAGNPADPRPRARLANVAIQLGMVDVAAAQFTALLAMGYEPARTHFGLGWVAQARGDRATAAIEYRRALALDPGLTAARNALARLEGRR
jgi:tetratricopeptide (TPR) repeat protein